MLTPPKAQNPLIQYLKLFKDPLTAMLLAAAVLSLCSQAAGTEDFTASYLGGTLLFVVFLNTLVDFIQARKSEAMVKVRTCFHGTCSSMRKSLCVVKCAHYLYSSPCCFVGACVCKYGSHVDIESECTSSCNGIGHERGLNSTHHC
jgi:hypothetical protein